KYAFLFITKGLMLLLIFFGLVSTTIAGENNIKGLLQGQFTNDQSEGVIENEFFIHRARLGISGKIHQQITYNLILGAMEPPDRNPHLVNAFVDFNYYTPYLKIRFGQFLLPFGLEGPQPITLNPMIERATATKKLNPFRMFRDIGLQLSGEYKIIDYAVAVINGSGANSPDENNEKDVIGTIGFSPIEGLRIGTSYHFGRYKKNTKSNLNRRRYGLDVEFVRKGLRLRTEIIDRQDEQADGSEKIDAGWYILAGYKFRFNLEPLIRYEQYYPDAHDIDVNSDVATIGLNYYILENNRISVNYEFKDDIENPKVGNRLTAQLQVVF
ncbi:TPA: hypothetical protein EYP66_09175, partial [Candidatus Poribacteria bacterium]|nr:hypothetical protein [Candidatus Poribacteria bacterium]